MATQQQKSIPKPSAHGSEPQAPSTMPVVPSAPTDLALGASHGGNATKAIQMLDAQAERLDHLFGFFLAKANEAIAKGQYPVKIFQLALKSQAQCRSSLAAISFIKNPQPSVAFIKQQNIAQQQQVNNSGGGNTLPPLKNISNPADELLEAKP